MFTGIIEEVGIVKEIVKGSRSAKLVVEANLVLEDLELGHSLSTNGVCLTVTQIKEKEFTADVMRETLSRSSLGGLRGAAI